MIPLAPGRSFGVEIEVFNVFFDTFIPPYNGIVPKHLNPLAKPLLSAGIDLGSNPDQWRFVQETSIKGKGAVEVVSPSLLSQDGLNQIATVCGILQAGGALVNRSCGLHVHHDASDFTCDELHRLLHTMHRWEDVIYSCLPPERRANETCRPMDIDIAELAVPCGETCDTHCTIKRMWYSKENRFDGAGVTSCKTRYHGLNLHPYWSLGTVEFRYSPSTLAFDKVQGWVGFTQGLVERANFGGDLHTLEDLHWEFEHLMGWMPFSDYKEI